MNVIGFDIGGTKSAVILADTQQDDIKFYGRKEISTTSDWRYVLDTLCEEAIKMAKEKNIPLPAEQNEINKIDKINKIDNINNIGGESDMASENPSLIVGISCGGPLSRDRKIICSPPNLPGWDHVPIVEYLEQKLLAPAYLENDADACALAEWRYGAGKGHSSVVFLTFGTGLGAGLILDNRLYRGAGGMAGEIGHVRIREDGPKGYGKSGSLEGFCSGGGISRLASIYVEEKRKNGKIPAFAAKAGECSCGDTSEKIVYTAKQIAEAARGGDSDALEIFRISGREFGRGLSIIIDLLNPDCIIAGSIYTRCHELLDAAMYEEIEKEALLQSRSVCKIKPALLGEQIGDYGAVMAALYHLEHN